MTTNKRALQLLMEPVLETARHDIRGVLFRRLLEEDPSFRGHFARLAMDLLNHRLEPEFFDELLKRYDFALNREQEGDYRQFFEGRAEVVRAELQTHLGAGPVHRVLVEAPDEFDLQIDGYRKKGGYSGAYFDGTEITLEPIDARATDSFYWLVNGERRNEHRLVQAIDRTTRIQAVLDH